MNILQKAIHDGSCILDLKAQDIESIFHQAVNHVIAQGRLPAECRSEVEAALLEREAEVSTAIGNAVAVPHAYLDAFDNPIVLFVRLAKPLNLGALDGIPTRFLFLLLGSPKDTALHLDTLAAIARLMSDDEFRYEATVAADRDQLLESVTRFRQRTELRATDDPKAVSPALQYTGRLGGGLVADVRRRLPHYAADFRDGIHTKSLSSTLFLYFACLAPAVTFGGYMGIETGGQIGTVEMIVASAICGVIYALFSGQPLVILGGTGPLLIFTVILYRLCESMEIPFLATRAWVGLWTGLLLILLSVTDASCLMRFFTRFTDEIFAALPWLVAATVRSLNHLRSLASMEEVMLPNGETRERVIHVRETRVTGFAIHLLVGLSLFLLPMLKTIPMAVLYGLFLFMGVVSMAGNQFFERLSLWVMDVSLYPATHYIRKVPFWTLHSFTLVQFLCLALLVVVEISPIAILFPLFIALLVPVRFLLNRFFRPEDLAALDSEEEPEEEAMQWV